MEVLKRKYHFEEAFFIRWIKIESSHQFRALSWISHKRSSSSM